MQNQQLAAHIFMVILSSHAELSSSEETHKSPAEMGLEEYKKAPIPRQTHQQESI